MQPICEIPILRRRPLTKLPEYRRSIFYQQPHKLILVRTIRKPPPMLSILGFSDRTAQKQIDVSREQFLHIFSHVHEYQTARLVFSSFNGTLPLPILSLVVRSPFRAKHHVVVQYMARLMKCPLLPLPPILQTYVHMKVLCSYFALISFHSDLPALRTLLPEHQKIALGSRTSEKGHQQMRAQPHPPETSPQEK